MLETITDFIVNMYSMPMYVIFFAYCVWRMTKRMQKTSLDGVIGTNPASEILLYTFLSPLIAPIDASITLYKFLWKKVSNKK